MSDRDIEEIKMLLREILGKLNDIESVELRNETTLNFIEMNTQS